MNLRASLGGKDVVSPLEDSEWEELHQRLRSKMIELTMPCCNGRAYMRVGPAGTQHFVHQVDIGCKQSESEVHQLAKLEIVRACRDLTLQAIPEYEGDGWRADVLVKHPKCDGVLEVQVSPSLCHAKPAYRTELTVRSGKCGQCGTHITCLLSKVYQ